MVDEKTVNSNYRPLSDPLHPVWSTVRFFILTVAVTFILWRNANNFDETEIKAILEIAAIAGGYEGITSYFNNRKGPDAKD